MRPDVRNLTSAGEMARNAGIDPKQFRAALRKAGPNWHVHGAAWTVVVGDERHRQMEAVMAELTGGGRPVARAQGGAKVPKASVGAPRDEDYVIDLCDKVLRQTALRQHRFGFLRGDAGSGGLAASLPVDAYYPALKLVVEYHERQHSEAVALFDRRMTVSGVSRGEQRRRYDQLRREVLPKHGLKRW